jgi:hypothetical protein
MQIQQLKEISYTIKNDDKQMLKTYLFFHFYFSIQYFPHHYFISILLIFDHINSILILKHYLIHSL